MTINGMDRKTIARLKADASLHVALVMKQEDCSKATALWMAWAEGQAGLAKRLGQKELPLEVKK